MNERRIVLDTNVLVSVALFPASIPRKAVDHAILHGVLLYSTATLHELDMVLGRKKLAKFVSEEGRREFVEAFVRVAHLVGISEMLQECRDPKDDKFLELALNGRATSLISGDDDLLVMNPFRGIPIVSPRRFVDEIAAQE